MESRQPPSNSNQRGIAISVETCHVEERSDPEQNHYFFSYTVTIVNNGTAAAKLLSRHWVISDSNGRIQEVRGDGVVGERPELAPGEGFRYTSAAVIATPLGTMHGSYLMRANDGSQFKARIAPFSLTTGDIVLH